MTKTYLSPDELAGAFPASLRQDAVTACATFPAVRVLGEKFSVRVDDEILFIPKRLHFDPTPIHFNLLTPTQREIVDCLLTRHTDGFVRELHLARIIGLNRPWIPPFVLQLSGEYVVEILNVIYHSLPTLGRPIYREFLHNNPTFLDLTGQRVASYWDCYYRGHSRQEYVGFKILEFFRSLQGPA